MTNLINELTEYFRKFPGVGPRQANRFVFHLLKQDRYFLKKLSDAIPRLKDSIKNCSNCCRFFAANGANSPVCEICRSQSRDTNTLMIVATDTDLDSIEKSGTYNGQYFVLGGTLPILHKNPQEKIRLSQLEKTLRANNSFEEIIVALSANPEGEYTTNFLRDELKKILPNAAVTVLGRGLSTGTEIEYSDSETIKNALKNRV